MFEIWFQYWKKLTAEPEPKWATFNVLTLSNNYKSLQHQQPSKI